MKILLYGKETKNLEELLKKLSFEIVQTEPDVIISYGGDGTLLSSERQFPCIPKLPLRNSQVCNKCPNHEDEIVLEKLKSSKLKLEEYKKLETEISSEKYYALNDFVIRNSDTTHTIRFKTSFTDKLLIGDGVVISTSFGSTGYFKSITQENFEEGFGVAFNNTTEKINPLFLKEQQVFNFSLTRGNATLSFDNSPDIFTLVEGSELIFKLSDQIAKIYMDTSLRCPNCKIIRN